MKRALRLHCLKQFNVGSSCKFSSVSQRVRLSSEQLQRYKTDGFLRVPSFFPKAEMELLLSTIAKDDQVAANVMPMVDSKGKVSKLTLWFRLANDTYSAVARSRSCHCRCYLFGVSSSVWPIWQVTCGRGGEIDRKRTIHVPHKDNAQGAAKGRRVGVAPGLRLLVTPLAPSAFPFFSLIIVCVFVSVLWHEMNEGTLKGSCNPTAVFPVLSPSTATRRQTGVSRC